MSPRWSLGNLEVIMNDALLTGSVSKGLRCSLCGIFSHKEELTQVL